MAPKFLKPCVQLKAAAKTKAKGKSKAQAKAKNKSVASGSKQIVGKTGDATAGKAAGTSGDGSQVTDLATVGDHSCSRMLNFLKYQSNPEKNKKGTAEMISSAAAALEAALYFIFSSKAALFLSMSFFQYVYVLKSLRPTGS